MPAPGHPRRTLRNRAELRSPSRRAYRMAMPLPAAVRAQGPYYTVDILDQLPDDGNRYEVVYGELLVTPAPRWTHQELVLRLCTRVQRYLERFPFGHLVMSPADVRWGTDTGVQPDLFVVPKAVARTMDWRQIRELLLVIEVLSPSSRRADRFTKRRRYQDARVPLYWIVDPKAEAVEVWTPDATLPSIEKAAVVWAPTEASEPLRLDVAALFRPIE
jgi:Uma2 family endonuclease